MESRQSQQGRANIHGGYRQGTAPRLNLLGTDHERDVEPFLIEMTAMTQISMFMQILAVISDKEDPGILGQGCEQYAYMMVCIGGVNVLWKW